MFDSSDRKDDRTPTPTDCQALNPKSTIISASGVLHLHSDNSEDTLQSTKTNLSMINLPAGLPSTALEIQSEVSSTIVLSATSSNAVATELVSLIDPSASPSDANLEAWPQTSTSSNLPFSVPPALFEVLTGALEISSSVSVVDDISDLPSNAFSLANVKALSGSDSCQLSADSPRTSISAALTVQKVSSVKEDYPFRITSDCLRSEPPLSDLPKVERKLVAAELFDRSSNQMLSASPLSTESSTMSPSSLVSMVELLDEVTPLLQSARGIPWSQIFILLFLQMVGPLTTHVISPFTMEFIRGAIGPRIGTNEQLEYVAGLLRSMFYFAEASTSLFWSRASDKVGRKPVILIGLIGSSLSMMCFGFSQSFWGSLVSYSLMSGLNGNDGVIKSMMAELVDATDLARIYAFIPLAKSAGASVGPIINGLLSRPTSSGKLPISTSGQASIKTFNIFLYLVTCSLPVILSITSFILAFFFLKETVKFPAPLSTPFKLFEPEGHHESELTHIVPQLHTKPLELNDDLAFGGAVVSVMAKKLPLHPTQLLSVRCLFMHPPVIIALVNFVFLSLIEISFRNIQFLFLASPTSFGGLGLSAEQTDNILSACGIINGIVQMIFFTNIHGYLGPKKSFTYGVASAVPLFLMFPVVSSLAKDVCNGIILWMALGVQVILFVVFNLSFGAIFMYITASPPTPESVGAINGLNQMVSNSLRGIVPGMTSGLFVLSVEKGYLGGNLVYVVHAAIAGVASMVAWYLPHKL